MRPTNQRDQPVPPTSARLYRAKHVSSTKTLAHLKAYQPRAANRFGADIACCDHPNSTHKASCHRQNSTRTLSVPPESRRDGHRQPLSLRRALTSSSELEPFHKRHTNCRRLPDSGTPSAYPTPMISGLAPFSHQVMAVPELSHSDPSSAMLSLEVKPELDSLTCRLFAGDREPHVVDRLLRSRRSRNTPTPQSNPATEEQAARYWVTVALASYHQPSLSSPGIVKYRTLRQLP